MANIMNVDYESIPRIAKDIRNLAQELNNEIASAYKSIDNMHSNWYGKRYNELVKYFNNITSEINELLTLVVSDIPFELETIANNYSQENSKRNITSTNKTQPRKISNISLYNDSGIKFLSTEVKSTKASVSKNFDTAKSKMNEIEALYGKEKWSNETSETLFKSKFTKLKNNIIKSFSEINSEFEKLMSEASSDVQTAEKSNSLK